MRHLKKRSTPPGEHQPVLLDAVLEVLEPRPGQIAVDCTVGWAGHSVEILRRLGPGGLLIGLDWDADNLPKACARLEAVGHPFRLEQANFAGLPTVLHRHGLERVDLVLADLGMSSMQVDDPERGFSYRRDGPLDMRMDRSRGRTAAQVLATIGVPELAKALREWGDEEQAETIAAAIVAARTEAPIERTSQLAHVVQLASAQTQWRLRQPRGGWQTHPAAKTFQALRILVNRELNNLEQLLRVLSALLQPEGRAAVISFHSGEDRLVKAAFRHGRRTGAYADASEDMIRPQVAEWQANPRARSAKLRWVQRDNDYT
ncbi:MAG: 16S rRNA (cytosine(1402)-N(4))-methyltransferase RsmH [Gemmataceae bacterium]|nr:16S rRNA (cytosine(1402)-N(4))-methyltransferase RsmH [Gemmataceae bacterium]